MHVFPMFNIWSVELSDYMFLKVVKGDKFLKSSSRQFKNLMDDGKLNRIYVER